MDSSIYAIECFELVLPYFFIILATIKLIKDKRLLTQTNIPSERAEKIVNALSIPIVYLALIYLIVWKSPLISDIPAIQRNAYIKTNAIAVSHSLSNPESYEKRYVDMEIDGKIENMTLYSFAIYEGREYEIVYLPNSKIGQVKTKKKYNIRVRW